MATNGASLGSIFDRLNSAPEYHPFNADTFSDWSMEAGDMVTVSRDGNSYKSPVHSSSMTWKGQSQISVSSKGNETRESISKSTKKKYSKGGSGYRNDAFLRQELIDDYNGLYSYFEVTSSRLYATFSGMYDGLSSQFEITRSRMYVDFYGMYDGLSSAFEITRSKMSADFQSAYDGLASYFELTRSRMAVDFQGAYDGLSSAFEITRSRMAVDFNNAYNGLSSSFQVTSSQLVATFQGKYDGLSSAFELTRSQLTASINNSYTQLSSRINAVAGDVSIIVEGTGSNKHIKPAVIQASIDAATQQSKISLSADKVIIDGSLVTSKITADYISSKIATIPTLSGISASFSGNVSAVGGITGSGIYYTGGSGTQALQDAIKLVQIVRDGNNYKLQYQKFNATGWQDAASPFSRAIASWTLGWSGGTFTAKANPQDQSCSTQIVQGTTSWDGNVATVPINGMDSDNPSYAYFTGRNITVDASRRDAVSGAASGRPGTSYNWNFTITRGDGTTKTLSIDCSSIYSDARSGYTQGIFSLASVTLQGSADSVFKEVSSGGTNYYTAGSAVTYYKGGNTYTYYTAGTATTYYKAGTAATYYNAGASTVIARGNSVTGTNRGSSVSVTKQGDRGPKLSHYGSKQLYYKSGSNYYTAGGTRDWYYVDGSYGAQYYKAGSSATYYNSGSSYSYYKGDGGTFTVQGSAVSVTRQGSSVSVTPIGTAVSVTVRGDSVSVTPINANSRKMLAQTTRYTAGSTVSNKYYTKS